MRRTSQTYGQPSSRSSEQAILDGNVSFGRLSMRICCAMVSLLAVVLSDGFVAVKAAAAQTLSSTSTSTPATLIRLDGQLTTTTGAPRTGSVNLVISLYANQADSTPLWVEHQLVALDQAGRYTVLAGATQADGVPQQYFLSGTARWIGEH